MMIPVINYYHSHEKQETSSRTTTGYMDNTLLARVSTKIGQTLPTYSTNKEACATVCFGIFYMYLY